ncbi:hypothetical protein [Amycolatopsis taiwanensis]|uniref:Uncharacterized protein n=1 Tax=Amycolatopsis taiwanensis TaxID=342230 RepID=A0A9W6VHH1_9PSEU|nr:hypothetical protein [Amycolatopsis taiwanensis]GLY67239.1 hypothetical protein Atai01_38580 [Amycolatopsis taiwanensis]
MSAEDVADVSSEDSTAEADRIGCLGSVLSALVALPWLYGAHNAVWWFNRACHNHAPPGAGLAAIFILPVVLVVFGLYAVLCVRLVSRDFSRNRLLLLVPALLVGAYLLTWAYWALMISVLYDPLSVGEICDGHLPAGWPSWIPIPLR